MTGRRAGIDLKELRHHPILTRLRRFSDDLGLWAIGHFVDESLRAMWRARALTAFSIGIIGLSLATVGGFVLVAQNLGTLVERLSSLEVSVYLLATASREEVDAARRSITAEPGVTSVRYVSTDDALAIFKETNPGLADVPDLLGANPFPASLEVSFRRDPGATDSIERLTTRLEGLAGVDHVGRDVLELARRFAATSRVFKIVAGCLGGVLLLSALFTVSNVVRLTVYTRLHEVQVLRLVGATAAYVRGTFVVEGLLHGLAGATTALAILYAAHRTAAHYLAQSEVHILGNLTNRFLDPTGILLILAIGAGLGAVGSLAATGDDSDPERRDFRLGRGFMRFNRGLLLQPWPIRVWVMLLAIVNLGLPLVFLPHPEAIVVLLSMLAALVLLAAITAATGFTRLLGLAHLVWIPLIYYLAGRLDLHPGDSPLGLWLRLVIGVNTVSLVVDLADIGRYVAGDRAETVKGL